MQYKSKYIYVDFCTLFVAITEAVYELIKVYHIFTKRKCSDVWFLTFFGYADDSRTMFNE